MPNDVAQDRLHCHLAGASRSILGRNGQPEPRLRHPAAASASDARFDKRSSFRLGHNVAFKAPANRGPGAPEMRP